jgi:HD-like signal output (HDOD) protein
MNESAAPFKPLTQPLRDLSAWTAYFRQAEIPILANTSEELEAMRVNEDNVDANMIGEMVADDPLMTLKVLAYSSTHRPARLVTDVETVTGAVMVMGISPFFNTFGLQPTIEDRFADHDEALQGLYTVIRRAHRAAHFALAFAVHRQDHDAAVIYEAALLHDFAEMLLWCNAPSLALQICAAQNADSTLRSSVAQTAALNVRLDELQQALMKSWRLPELLIRITDDAHAEHPSVRSVMLAIRLARHTSKGWDNAAIPDDVNEIASLLNLSHEATMTLLQELDR